MTDVRARRATILDRAVARVPRDKVVGDQDAFGQALTFALGVVVFALIGRGVDSWLGTRPAGVIVGVVLGVTAASLTLYYRYQARMARLDDGQAWVRSDRKGAR